MTLTLHLSLHLTLTLTLRLARTPTQTPREPHPFYQVPFLEGFKLTKGMPLAGGGVQIMAKVAVNGEDEHPVFTLAKESFPGEIDWNFNGIFVFDKEGSCVHRFNSKALKEVDAAITALV